MLSPAWSLHRNHLHQTTNSLEALLVLITPGVTHPSCICQIFSIELHSLAFRNFLQTLFPLRCFRSSILYSSQTFDHSDWPPSSSWPIHICHYPQFLTTSSSCQRKHKCASSLTIWSLQTEKYFMVQNQQNQEHKCIQGKDQENLLSTSASSQCCTCNDVPPSFPPSFLLPN